MTETELGLLVVLAVVGAGAVYGLACWIWPFAACRRCEGSGKKRSPSGKAWRDCPRCKGTGKRLRLGWRIANQAGKNRKYL